MAFQDGRAQHRTRASMQRMQPQNIHLVLLEIALFFVFTNVGFGISPILATFAPAIRGGTS
jgi:hypothetical protein